MARRSSPVNTTVTSKWVAGGSGTLRDAFPLTPTLKLVLDLISYLIRHPIYIVFPAIFLYALSKLLFREAILATLLVAITLSLAKLQYTKYNLKRNIKYLHKQNTHTATVPLDPTNNRRAVITLDKSILIGGESGSGKSNMVWKILKGLNEYNIPYRLHVIDPAGGVELQDLENSPFLVNYVDRANKADRLIARVRDDMDARLSYMRANKSRKHTPTTTYPLNVLIIDELLLLTTQLRQGVASPLGELLAVGRKAGFIVIACTQLGQVDTIGRIRDLFPQRICFAVRTSDMADAILGTYATRDGAEAHLLSRPGEGYVFAETQHTHEKYFERFRSELITDTHEIASAGQTYNSIPQGATDGRPLDDPPRNKPTDTAPLDLVKKPRSGNHENTRTAVYELYAEDGTLMYVGLTNRPNKRFKEHQSDKAWWNHTDMSKTIITWYPNRKEASYAEATQIKALRPIYNQLHNYGQD